MVVALVVRLIARLVSLKKMGMAVYIVKLYFHYGSGDGLKLRLRNIGAYNKMLYVLPKL